MPLWLLWSKCAQTTHEWSVLRFQQGLTAAWTRPAACTCQHQVYCNCHGFDNIACFSYSKKMSLVLDQLCFATVLCHSAFGPALQQCFYTWFAAVLLQLQQYFATPCVLQHMSNCLAAALLWLHISHCLQPLLYFLCSHHDSGSHPGMKRLRLTWL